MNTIFSFVETVHKNSKVVLGGIFIAVLTLVSFYIFEMASRAQFPTNEAFAWSCVAFDADVDTIEKGATTTLSWSFSADSGIYVTIDQISGQEWSGVTGSVQVSPTVTTTYKAVAHKTGTDVTYECSTTVKVTEPPKEEPPVPACPYVASDTVTVVNFNGGKKRSDTTILLSNNAAKTELTASQSLPAGTYTIKTSSWDGYLDRVNVTQPKEQWNVEVRGGTWKKGPVGPTTDIADFVIQDTKNNTFANAITLTETGTTVAVVHAAAGDTSSPNSVVPVCVAFEKQTPPKEEPPVPACPYVASDTVTVVNFNGGKKRSDATLIRSDLSGQTELTASQTLPAGTYTIKTASWDGYLDRVNVTQPHEQWNVEVRTSSWKKGPVGPTTDIEDFVIENTKNNTFVNAITLTESGTTVAAVHAVAGDTSSPNSVVPVCVAFEKQTDNDTSPSCSMNVSSSRVNKGESVTLSWNSGNTVSASIDQGIGSTTLSGSKNITIQSATTFTGIFKDSKGKEVTCSAGVSLKGGGGSCVNCDDDDDDDDEDEDDDDDDDSEPVIVLGKTITKAGSYVTLDQVPYTGFEAGPMLTTFFWLMVLALSVLIAYVVTRYQHFARLKVAFATEVVGTLQQEDEDRQIQKSVMTPPQSSVILSDVPTHTQSSNADAISIIEEMAHKENILLSPEALRLMYAEIKNTDSSPTQYLTGLFEIAKTEYPVEDGWILLSKERAEKLLGKSQNNTVLNVNAFASSGVVNEEARVAAEPKAYRVEQRPISRKNTQTATTPMTSSPAQMYEVQESTYVASSDDETALLFIDSLANLEKKKVFDVLRGFASRGNDVGALITAVVRKLDEVYRFRVEGGQTPNKEIAGKTATWSNGDFENVLGILVECIDYTYANNQVGTKVALTEAFEHFEKKN